MTELRATAAAPWLRLLERLLPVPVLLVLLFPLAWVRALVHRGLKGPTGTQARPVWLSAAARFQPPFLDRLPVYLHRTLEFFPDRLIRPKWRRRCEVTGLAHLQPAQAAGGTILAFVHTGSCGLLRGWLRAAGVPLSLLVSGRAADRQAMLRRKDRWALLPAVPTVFHQSELAAAIRHLQAGLPLAMALDGRNGRQMLLRHPEGWSFLMATGALRLARRHGLPLCACTIHAVKPWRYVIEISPPVPPRVWERGDEAVGLHLLDGLLPALRRHPEQSAAPLTTGDPAPLPARPRAAVHA